ncbi:MAG TPA: type II toxin-antitoxin system VapC family toxin [Gammaproteobacteria bacterium]|nr:type II toxin-antitoxin system VapC family toxin [Gammaproteobacteria bacterium]
MIRADTSVWIDHLRTRAHHLVNLLNSSQVVGHPFVIGELACGNLRGRDDVLKLLNDLSRSPQASHEEALYFIERNEQRGQGIGFIDAHLLASTSLAGAALIWTRDKRLQKVARKLKLAAD